MYATKSSASNVAGETHQNVWKNYRRPTNTINFSDIVEDGTIYDSEMTFESSVGGQPWRNEHDVNEPEIDPDAVSVDYILGNSIVHEIQSLSRSKHGALSTSIRDSFSYKPSTSQFPINGNNDFSCASNDFRPGEEFGDQLSKDQYSWEQEFAEMPPQGEYRNASQTKAETSHRPPPKIHGKLTSMTDFSVAYLADSISGSTDMSIGRFFQNRCGDLGEIITKTSPERHLPMALVAAQQADAYETNSQATSSFFADDESNTKTTKISTTTYDKEGSITNLASLANKLDDEVESPRTFLNKLYAKKSFTKPLTKSNVEKHENSMCLQVSTPTSSRMTLESKQLLKQDYRKFEQFNEPKTDMDGMLNRMNSTKIEEQGDWYQKNSSVDTQSVDTHEEPTLSDSHFSSNKNRSSWKEGGISNGSKNKGFQPSLSPQENGSNYATSFQAIKNQSPHNDNVENENARKISRKRVFSPNQQPLNDVSSIMLNNLRINSPNSEQVAPVETCAPAPFLSSEEQRRYVNRNQSPDHKFSLPSYGIQGLPVNHQDAAIAADKRCNSQLSTHSEFTQQDGKFPLKSNSSELVWECVKLRKSITKSFVIKNTSEKKLTLKITVYGPGFQVASCAETDSLALQGNECRTISVTFCPTIIGKAIGKVVFRPTRNWPEYTERSVDLWAYGGSTVLQLQGLERGPVGSSFLKIAETSNIRSTTLQRTFSIYNKGPLNGVATIFVKPKTDQYINENNIVITPSKCVIRPDCSATITVTYKLRRRDLDKLRDKSCEVSTVGTLEVIFGAEANRQRIASMLTRRGDIPSMYRQLQFLVDGFPVASSENFNDFREHIDNVSDLFGCFKTSEIALTINRTNLDESRDNDLTMEDSVLFRSMIETTKQNGPSNASPHDLK